MSLLWKYAFGGMAFLCIMLGIRLYMETRHSAKLQAQVTKLSAEKQRLEDEGKQRQDQVREVIKQGKDRIVYVTREAEKIENAPLPGGCKTPELVMGADL